MKKNLFILFIIAGLQTNTFAAVVNGYITFNNNKTKNVKLIIPTNVRGNVINYASLQNKLKYVKPNFERMVAKPDEIKEFGFYFNEEKIVMKAIEDNIDLRSVFSRGKKIFLKLEIEGKLGLFTYVSTSTSSFASNNNADLNKKYFIYFLNNSLIYVPQTPNGKMYLQKLFEHCKTTGNYITNNFNSKNFEYQLVRRYNNYCNQ